MDAETLSIIKSQTGADDMHLDDLHIERVYFECGSDIVKTIMKLSDLKDVTVQNKEPSVFDDIRKIVDEKEQIYFTESYKNARPPQPPSEAGPSS